VNCLRGETTRNKEARANGVLIPSLEESGENLKQSRHECDEVVEKLRVERKRVCSSLVSHFPLKKISRPEGVDKKSRVITLGSVTTLEFTKGTVLSAEEQHDIHAALGFLVQLLSHLASYLDITLPFPCGVCPKAPKAFAVYHPMRSHWYDFSLKDGTCTKSSAKALKLMRENLRRLCETQGISVPLNSQFPHNTTVPILKLLDACLHARHFGSLYPPFKAPKKCTMMKDESPRRDVERDDQAQDEFSLLSSGMVGGDESWIVLS